MGCIGAAAESLPPHCARCCIVRYPPIRNLCALLYRFIQSDEQSVNTYVAYFTDFIRKYRLVSCDCAGIRIEVSTTAIRLLLSWSKRGCSMENAARGHGGCGTAVWSSRNFKQARSAALPSPVHFFQLVNGRTVCCGNVGDLYPRPMSDERPEPLEPHRRKRPAHGGVWWALH